MPRPPLPIGTYGAIHRTTLASGEIRASTRFRDLDGVTRKIERTGPTAAAAKNRLREHLRDRAQQGPREGLNGDSRLREAAELWMTRVEQLVSTGQRSPNTAQLYRLTLDTHVLPALGELRLREVTVPRLDHVIQTMQLHKGTATAKVSRTVLSGLLGLAVRYGAIGNNPARDVGRISGPARRQPRALTVEERQRWVRRLSADPAAQRKDLPDLCEFMLATGVRIGEALAVTWDEIDLAEHLVVVEHTIIRRKGIGLIRKTTKTESGERTLRLPRFAVAMLRRRKLEAGSRGPLFPDSLGGWRDPSNTSRDLRNARGSDEFGWVTSHVFRKSAATWMEQAGLSARDVADQLGHARVSMTQDVYFGRRILNEDAADALDDAYRSAREDDSGDDDGGAPMGVSAG